ncbi:Protein of unknown function, partial [Cotesia congregata]
ALIFGEFFLHGKHPQNHRNISSHSLLIQLYIVYPMVQHISSKLWSRFLSEDKIDKFSKSASPFIGGHDYLLNCDYKLTSPNNNERIVKFRDFKRCDHLALFQALSQRLDLRNMDIDDKDPNELTSIFLTLQSSIH